MLHWYFLTGYSLHCLSMFAYFGIQSISYAHNITIGRRIDLE